MRRPNEPQKRYTGPPFVGPNPVIRSGGVMKRAVCSAAATLATIALSLTTVSSAQAPRPAPTFAKDVAPIMFEKCAGCHRPGEVAPMSLLSYEDARPWAKAIKIKVLAREMPPWGADHEVTLPMRTDRSLTEREIQTIAA